jgi:membrane protease YdiL (CAAX protease family)
MKTTIKLVLIFIGVELFFSIAISFLWAIFAMLSHLGDTAYVEDLLGNFELPVGVLIFSMMVCNAVLLLYLWFSGYISKEKAAWSPISAGYLGVTALICFASIFLLDYLMQHLSWLPNWVEDTFIQLQSNWLGIFSIALFGPVVEELFFRGAITKALLKQYSPRRAIVISALIFGIIHFNPAQVVGAFFMGLLLAWLYYKTASLIPVILIHILNNSLSVYLSTHYPADDTLPDVVDNNPLYYACLAASATIFILSFLYFRKRKVDYNWKG